MCILGLKNQNKGKKVRCFICYGLETCLSVSKDIISIFVYIYIYKLLNIRIHNCACSINTFDFYLYFPTLHIAITKVDCLSMQ